MSKPGYPPQHGDPNQPYGYGSQEYSAFQNPSFAQTGYPQGGYPPPQGGYPPSQSGYPPSQSGYPPSQSGYPPSQSGYPPPPSYENATKTVEPMPAVVDFPSSGQYGGVISFDDKSIRRGFIRRVYFILMCQLGFTVASICLFMFCKPVKVFVQDSPHSLYIYLSSYIIFFVLYFVLVCCDSVRRNYPSNLICLVLFTVALSYLVATISSFHDTNVVLILMGVTTLVCMSVMIFSCQTKYDFTTWGGVLFCAAVALFFLSIFTPIWLLLKTTAGMIILGGALALLFVAFLAYDTQLIMGGKKYELSPEEYIFGALALYMDIIRIFLLLLALFGRRQ